MSRQRAAEGPRCFNAWGIGASLSMQRPSGWAAQTGRFGEPAQGHTPDRHFRTGGAMNELESTCYHEGGHGVVARALKLRVKSILLGDAARRDAAQAQAFLPAQVSLSYPPNT